MDWPPPGYRPDHGTGYRVTLQGFRQLVGYPAYRSAIAAFLQKWYSLAIDSFDEAAMVRSNAGAPVDIEALHERIQADPKAQYYLYQTAMNLWR